MPRQTAPEELDPSLERAGPEARSRAGRGAILGARVGRARAFVRFLRDPSASLLGKLGLVLAVAYVVWPADFVPDVPIVGWLDDVGVATIALAWVSRVLDRYRDEPRPSTPRRDRR